MFLSEFLPQALLHLLNVSTDNFFYSSKKFFKCFPVSFPYDDVTGIAQSDWLPESVTLQLAVVLNDTCSGSEEEFEEGV